MFRRNFLFGVDSDTANVIGVTASDIYQPGKGFGFVIEQNRREQELLKISELNAGFDTSTGIRTRIFPIYRKTKTAVFWILPQRLRFWNRRLEKPGRERREGFLFPSRWTFPEREITG